MTEYDCLLLEHVLGQRPADSAKVSSGPGIQGSGLGCIPGFGPDCDSEPVTARFTGYGFRIQVLRAEEAQPELQGVQ